MLERMESEVLGFRRTFLFIHKKTSSSSTTTTTTASTTISTTTTNMKSTQRERWNYVFIRY